MHNVGKDLQAKPDPEDENLMYPLRRSGTSLRNYPEVTEAGLFKPATPGEVAKRPYQKEWTEDLIYDTFKDYFEELNKLGIVPTINPENSHHLGFMFRDDIYDIEGLEELLHNALWTAKTLDNPQ